MVDIERLRELFDSVSVISDKKMEAIKAQKYEVAVDLRNEERDVINEIDKIVGFEGYYNELLKMEEINHHLETLKNSIDRLKFLGLKMDGAVKIEIDAESLLELQSKHFKIQQDILNFRLNVGLPEKKFDKKLVF